MPTVSGLAKVAIFTTNVDAENQCLIKHKCVYGALNRHFCQTRVMGWLFKSLSVFQEINVLFANVKNYLNIINDSLANIFVQDNWFAIDINSFLS